MRYKKHIRTVCFPFAAVLLACLLSACGIGRITPVLPTVTEAEKQPGSGEISKTPEKFKEFLKAARDFREE